MSLFGDSPPASQSAANAQASSKALFGEEASGAPTPSSSSLFADEGNDASPWSMPTPKKTARRELVKTLLPATDVPESYIDSFDTVLESKDRVGAGIGLTAIKKILESSGLSAADQSKILNLVVPGGHETTTGLGRSEFNVLLALVGLGQEGEEMTLDGVDERRRKLPQPRLSYFNKLKTEIEEEAQAQARPSQAAITPPSGTSPRETNSSRPRRMRQDSIDNLDSDPWASPVMTKPLGPPPTSDKLNGVIQNGESEQSEAIHPTRTTSRYKTQSETANGRDRGGGDSGAGWTNYAGDSADGSAAGFSEQPTLGGGFGGQGDDDDNPDFNPRPSRPVDAGAAFLQGAGEIITVTMLNEKQGMFLFQHRNYEIKSLRKGTTVIRRFSDFVWLLDCLLKRYPFRRLPLLPPKRVSVNGRHFAADSASFLDKRRRGLVRFCNALIAHPILSQEQLVLMFLTVPTDFSVWRKQASVSVDEEFKDRILPPNLEDSLPPTLSDTFETVRAGAKRSSDIYIQLCTLLERLCKRNEGLAADSLRLSLALTSLTESAPDTYAIDTNDVPLLNEGIRATAKHLSTAQALLEDEAQAWDTGVLEDLKRQRDTLVGMRDLFDRRDRLARDNIPQLEKRIEASETKLQALRSKAPEAVKAGEIEKVEGSIIRDKEDIVRQHARGVFIRECVRDEIGYFSQLSLAGAGALLRDWGSERVKYSELMAGCWRGLMEEVEGIRLGS